MGRAKNLIKDVQRSGIVPGELHVRFGSPSHLTQRRSHWICMATSSAQIRGGSPWRLKQHSADPAGIVEARPRESSEKVEGRRKGGKEGQKSTEAGVQTTECNRRPSLSKGGAH